LLSMGYTFLRVQQEDFFRVLELEHFSLTPRARLFLGTLELQETNAESASSVAAWLLRSIFLEPLPVETRRNIGMYILAAVTRHHPRKTMLARLRVLLQHHLGNLAILQLRAAYQLLSDWEATQRSRTLA
jgi:hypothetical protein